MRSLPRCAKSWASACSKQPFEPLEPFEPFLTPPMHIRQKLFFLNHSYNTAFFFSLLCYTLSLCFVSRQPGGPRLLPALVRLDVIRSEWAFPLLAFQHPICHQRMRCHPQGEKPLLALPADAHPWSPAAILPDGSRPRDRSRCGLLHIHGLLAMVCSAPPDDACLHPSACSKCTKGARILTPIRSITPKGKDITRSQGHNPKPKPYETKKRPE